MGRYKKLNKKEEEFLLQRLRQEWQSAERSEKLYKVAQNAKKGGIFLAKSLLAFASIAGILTIAAVAPNVFGAYGKMKKGQGSRLYERRVFKEELERLRHQGLVRARKTAQGYEVFITPKGKKHIIRESLKSLHISKPAKWDRTWWLVAFDIPRKYNAGRNALRERLKQIGMEKLQASIFISRYPCDEEVRFTAHLFGLEQYLVIAHVDSLEGYGDRLINITARKEEK